MRKLISIIFILIINLSVYSQDKLFSDIYFQSKGGILLAHRASMSHLIQKNTYGFELGFEKYKQENHLDSLYGFPSYGFNVDFKNFGNNSVLGYAVSINQFNQLPIYQSKKTFYIDFRFGLGLGYITERYHEINNPTNNAIGSNLNAKVNLQLLFSKTVKQLNYGFGIELSHYSNGAFTHPNLGLNSLQLLLSISNFNTDRKNSPMLKKKKITSNTKNFLIEVVGSTIQTLPNPYFSKRYPIIGIRPTLQMKFAEFWNFETSLDFIYNGANLYVYPDSTFINKDVPQIGVYIGASYQFYKSNITFGLGYYLFDVIDANGPIYNKIGYRYYFNDKIFGLFNVKANFGKAEYFEFGIGYKF